MNTEEIEEKEIIEKYELFQNNLYNFIDEISALRETLPLQIKILEAKHDVFIKDLEKYSTVEKNVEESEEDSQVFTYTLKDGFEDRFFKISKILSRVDIALKIIPRNYIVSIISQYDAFLGETLRILYLINPNLVRSSEKTLTVDDIFQFDSIDDIHNHYIEKEVDSMLREEHYEQLRVLERKVSKISNKEFTLTKNLPILKDFVELTQRRNLFVHTNGVITRQYIESNKIWKFESNNLELVTELKADADYCEKAYSILYELAVKLTQVLWRKFLPESLEDADKYLNNIIYDNLEEKEYDLAIIIGDFATETIKKYSSESLRKYILINKALAYKLKGNTKNCASIIANEDWSIGNEFKLAKCLLEDNYDDAFSLMKKIGDSDEIINKEAYKKWVLFSEVRKTEEFKTNYKEIFNEDFHIEDVHKLKPKKNTTQEEKIENEINDSEIVTISE